MMIKKFLVIFCLAAFTTLVQADDPQSDAKLDKIILQMSAKQWVTTQTALLTVNINATLTNADLVNARSEIMNKLAKIAAGEWHLTRFDRSQDSSGLEKLSVIAEARVPQASLTNVYQSAKNISKPGATYEISGIEFKPSLEETQKVKQQLREQLYQQVKDELGRLNKIYTDQNYSVNRMAVFEGEGIPIEAKAARVNALMMNAMASAPAPALAVSNELIMSVLVEAASNRAENGNSANH